MWSTRRRWSRSSAAAVGAPRFPSAVPPWAGCPWDRARSTRPPISGGWGWIPGPLAIVAGRPAVDVVYAPALVAFIGGGGWGASLSIGGPAVGWVPLGPPME